MKNTTQEPSIRWMRLEKAPPDGVPRLVGLEDVSGEAERDWIDLVFLAASSSAADRRGRADAPADCLRRMCSPGPPQGGGSTPRWRVTLTRVEDHLRAAGHQAALLLGDYVCLATGGSSGQRGVFVQTIGEYADYAAAILRYPVAGMLAAGRSPDGTVIAMAAAAAPVL